MSGNRDFQIKNGVLTKYKGSGGRVTVPDGVTEIGMRAFKNCAAITEIVLPESLEVIGFDTFFGCTGLRQMFLPKGVREIVEHQERPENVSLTDYCLTKKYHTTMFAKCDQLAWIEVDPKNKIYFSYAGMLFQRGVINRGGDLPILEGNEMIYCPKGYDKTPEFPPHVICVHGFCDCKKLKTVSLPEGVITCGSFCGCTDLERVQLPASLEELDSFGMFEQCPALKEVVLPSERLRKPELLTDFLKELSAVLVAPYISLDLLPTSCKSGAAVGFAKWLSQGREVPETIHEEYMSYIHAHLSYLYPMALKHEELMVLMLQEEMIPKNIISELLERSTKQGRTPITAMLLKYQETHGGTPDPFKALEAHIKIIETNVLPVAVAKQSWTYKKLEEGTLCLNQWRGTGVELIVSVQIGKAVVTMLGDEVCSAYIAIFNDMQQAMVNTRMNLRSAWIPEGITALGHGSFNGCKSLTDAYLPQSVEQIGDYAFAHCPKLTIHAPARSYAERYAKEHNIPFQPIEE